MNKTKPGFKRWVVNLFGGATSLSCAHHKRYAVLPGTRVMCPDGRVRAVSNIGNGIRSPRKGIVAGLTFKQKHVQGRARFRLFKGVPVLAFEPNDKRAFR